MVPRYEIVVIGGGPAGMMAAYYAAKEGAEVLLLEKKDKCGKKILLTGKGRCNITNTREWEDFKLHVHPNSAFYKNAFFHCSNKSVIEFFTSAGLPLEEQRGQRVFPLSQRSSDVRETMLRVLSDMANVTIISHSEVLKIEDSNREGSRFYITTLNDDHLLRCDTYFAQKIILATGGLSYPATGSTGGGHKIAKSLGHTIVDTHPSLTALKPVNYNFLLIGLTLKNVGLTLLVDGNPVQTEEGELSFTDGGIEGALGFRVSRKGVAALKNGSKVELVIDLKVGMTPEQIKNRVTRETLGKKTISMKKYLSTFIPSQAIVPFMTMNKDLSIANLPVRLKNWKFEIKGYVGYDRCVVTAGGVSLEDVSRKSMESKKVPGIYFAGELLDLDGDTGGYNLQIAFSTGALAGYSAAKSLKGNI